MNKTRRISAMAAALLICSGIVGYMPQSSLSIGSFTANAATDTISESVEINEANFPDENFRKYIKETLDADGDGVLSAEEIADVTVFEVNSMGISDLTGIEYFTSLETLWCYANKLTTIDVSNNTALTGLFCDFNQLTSIDVSKNTALFSFTCEGNQITSLDLSNNPTLRSLYCLNNQLTSLDLSKNTNLGYLYCGKNQLTSLDLSNNTALKELSVYSSCLTSLDLSNNTALEELCCYDNQLTSLDLSNNPELTKLWCYNNQLTSLDLSKNTALEILKADDNKFEIAITDNTFDLSTLPAGFDVSKASEWTNGTVKGNILTVEDITKEVTYKYGCGNEHSEVFTLVPPKTETPVETTTTTNTTTTSTATTTTTAIFTTTTYIKPSYTYFLNVYPYDEADTIYEIGEELDFSTICVYGYGGGGNFHADIFYISLDRCGPTVTVDASEFDNTKPGTYTIYVKWHDAVDSFDVTVVESDNAETPAATATTPAATTTTAAPETTTTATTTTTTAMFTTTTFAPPSYSCSLNVYPYDEADTIYEIGEELDYSTICVHGYGTMTSFGSTTYMDIPYISLDKCGLTIDASEFDNTKPGTYTIYVEWYDAVDSFDVTVVEPAIATSAATTTSTTTTTTTTPTTTFTTTTFAPPSYSCSLNVYPYDEADTIYEIGEELDFSTICVHGYGTMTSFGSTSYLDIPYVSLDKCGSVTIDASEFDNTKPGTYTIYVEWYNAKDSFEVTVIDESATTSTTTTAPETTTTTTPATTTTPEENLPQTGYSEIYRYIMLIAGAMVIFGIYAMAKGRKEDITG